jgi:hypothetical protein
VADRGRILPGLGFEERPLQVAVKGAAERVAMFVVGIEKSYPSCLSDSALLRLEKCAKARFGELYVFSFVILDNRESDIGIFK